MCVYSQKAENCVISAAALNLPGIREHFGRQMGRDRGTIPYALEEAIKRGGPIDSI
jgi:hypothetical protein